MALDPALETALEAEQPLVFHAVEMALAGGGFLRLIDGSLADITISGQTFTAEHATYGTLIVAESFTDGVSDEAPHFVFGVMPPTNTAAATLAASAQQGMSVRVWMGALNRATGQPIAVDEFFVGEVDVPTIQASKNNRVVEIDCASIWERLFENDEGLGLTSASHQAIWPGETGFDMVDDTDRQLPWGADAPRPGAVTYTRYNGKGFIADAINSVLAQNAALRL